jgi:dihydroflavonol-4-reductase
MVFVTGATGFLGSYLAKSLVKNGTKVRALKRSTSTFELLGEYAKHIEWVEGDLMDVSCLETALSGIDKIYNCAGAVLFKRTNKRDIAVNAEGCTNLFNAALYTGVKKVVHVSSTIVLGMPIAGKTIDENQYPAQTKSSSSYFQSKRAGELEAWRANAEGLKVVVVNPAGILGAGKWNHEPMNAFKEVYKGLDFYTTGSNGFIDVRDTAEVMIQLMESEINGERFILMSENVTIQQLLFLIADELKMRRPRLKVTHMLGEIAWRYEAIRSLLTQTDLRFSADEMRIARVPFNYSNTKISTAINYPFRTVAQSVHDTAVCFLESQKKGMDYAVFE